ncbi:cytokine receptor common subunit gamma-like isoform X1 [Hemiscyllium ocellatum]|uniref:cytokine receptor common subunit gamma-like isoform X1 n=1 Tax=Hemiscyllium ocellatum TaxID=170820 RepID=UPI002965F898|nr:cytokine receptor common subunit gamma-like isoform X1 [Hemiscyllium ocellatum]
MARQYTLKRQILPQRIYWICLIVLNNVALNIEANDVNCIVYNDEYMECRWKHTEGKPNHTLFYWYTSTSPEECGNYIQENGYNVGCYFSKDKIIEFENFYIYTNGSRDSGNVPTTFQLQNYVKLYPPTNVTLNMTENNELLLSWESPAKLLKCRMYEIRHRSNKDKDWQLQVITAQTKYVLSSVDPEKFYTFQVRSKINQYCASTELWSEWSSAVHWGKDPTQPEGSAGLRTIITVVSLLGLILLVIFVTKNERLKVIIIPKIPNPGRSFDPLFNNHNGNFQDWLGVPKDALEGFKSTYHENVCIVTESPVNPSQSGVHGGSYEQSGMTQIPGKLPILATKGEIQPKSTSPAMLFSDIAVFVESSRYAINENIYVRV